MEDIPDGVCIVCGHSLSSHVSELRFYRCHSIAPDGLQCECHLRKIGLLIDEPTPLEEYDMKTRVENGPLGDAIKKLQEAGA